tara:strand:+ start:598 stop:840 length:243 start_codon:yes stop_codon:yes gene_type:complete
MSVINIYKNEALQYRDALSNAIDTLESELKKLTDRAPTVIETISDGDLYLIESYAESIRLLEKMMKQIEDNVSTPAEPII